MEGPAPALTKEKPVCVVVKLVALFVVGPFVLFVLFDGPIDFAHRLAAEPAVARQVLQPGSPVSWLVTSLLSAMAFLCLRASSRT